MLPVLGLSLLALITPQDPPTLPCADVDRSMLGFEVRFLDFEDLSWRASALGKLKSVEHREGISVWLADRATLAEITIAAQSGPDGKPFPAPKLVAAPGAKAEIAAFAARNYVAHCEPVETVDEKGNTRVVGFRPEFAKVHDGCRVSIIAKIAERGTKLQVTIEESRLARLHPVKTRGSERSGTTSYFHVPEVLRGRAEGEWSVPEGESILICLGAYAACDDDGKSSTRERAVAITPRPVSGMDVDFGPPAPR